MLCTAMSENGWYVTLFSDANGDGPLVRLGVWHCAQPAAANCVAPVEIDAAVTVVAVAPLAPAVYPPGTGAGGARKRMNDENSTASDWKSPAWPGVSESSLLV